MYWNIDEDRWPEPPPPETTLWLELDSGELLKEDFRAYDAVRFSTPIRGGATIRVLTEDGKTFQELAAYALRPNDTFTLHFDLAGGLA